ncbi:MAG: hypothetical protein RL754_1031 [Bacteroidota bacterium]|jgi:hypothetical protein
MANLATPQHHARVAALTFAGVYPHYLAKVQNKGRSEAELLEVIQWLTGYTQADLDHHIATKSTFQTFFGGTTLHPNAHLITGTICGYKIQDLDNDLTRAVRYLDKLVDELAKGRPMAKILRGT